MQNAVIDGEIVCLDEEGRSIFNELLFRRGPPIFYVFDLLYLNERDIRRLPLIERKETLRSLIDKSGLTDVICGKYVEGRGVDLFNEVVRRNNLVHLLSDCNARIGPNIARIGGDALSNGSRTLT